MIDAARRPPQVAHGIRSSAPLVLALLAGLAARLVGWGRVFTASGVRFVVDTDPNYHVLQARRLLEHGPSGIWFDPWLNWPFGADVPWPPLFDLLIAGAARLGFGGSPTPDEIERAAAVLPVVLGVATLAVVAALGRTLLGRGQGAGPALLVALLMSHVAFSAVGRADQHVAEILLSSVIALSFVWSWAGRTARARWLAAAIMGIAVALAFWNWMGSAFNLVLPVTFAAMCHVLVGGDAARRVASGLTVALGWAAALLVGSVVAWGAPGALGRGTLVGITGVHVALTACGAAFAALLVLASRGRPSAGPTSRILEVGAASALPALAVLGLAPVLREGVRQGLTALAAANPWYADVGEFRHFLFSCDLPLSAELAGLTHVYGLGILAAALAAPALLRRWRGEPADRPVVLFLACWAVPYLALALIRRRFAAYFTIPLALLAWEGLRFVSDAAIRRLWPRRAALAPLLAWLGAVAVVAPSVRDLAEEAPRQPESHLAAMRWLAVQPAPEAREGVLAPWGLGHLVLYYAQRPVVVSPFGTEGGTGAMEFAARFNLATAPGEAERMLVGRRIGFVVLSNPLDHVAVDQGFGGGGAVLVERVCSLTRGRTVTVKDEYADRLAPRLYYFDGLAAPGRDAAPADGFRLVYETPARSGEQLKIFGVVPGARVALTGALASRHVTATALVRTNDGREFVWSVRVAADAAGSAQLRLPYATGRNGAIAASPFTVSDGVATVTVVATEEDVMLGRSIAVDLVRGRTAGGHR